MDIGIYLQGKRLDLFKDENINITVKNTDINNIGKIFTDFSKSFTVPASNVNNAIFQHFYDIDVDGTFNSNIRIDCLIEIDTIPFKIGKIQLEGITMDMKEPNSYKITFYGNLKQLDDSFGDDFLNAMDFSEYNHFFTRAVVTRGINDPTWMNNDMIYPLISNNIAQYGGPAYDDINTSGPIDFNELKPGLRVYKIIEKIEQHYNIKFESEFFKKSMFKNLMLWLSNGADKMKTISDDSLVKFSTQGNLSNGSSINLTTNVVKSSISVGFGSFSTITISLIIQPQPGYDTREYRVSIFKSDNGTDFSLVKTSEYVTGTKTFVVSNNKVGDTYYYFDIDVSDSFNYRPIINAKRRVTSYIGYPTTYISTYGNSSGNDIVTLQSIVNINGQMPNIKVKDFLTGLIKMFNLVIRPVNTNTFKIETMDYYDKNHRTFDITEFVDIDNIGIDRPKIFSEIIFKYQKTETIIGAKYRRMNDPKDELGYGDLRAKYEIDNKAELKIELPFELMMLERLQVIPNPTNSAIAGDLTDIHIGQAIKEDNWDPAVVKPFLFFDNGIIDISEYPFRLSLQYADGATAPLVNRSHQISNENDILREQITDSLNFNADLSTWDYEIMRKNLYSNYWSKYIRSVYDKTQRKFSYKAVLPPSIINRVTINDKFIINDKKYNIEDYNINLINGETKLNLSHYIKEFDYELGVNLLNVNCTSSTKWYSVIVKTKGNWTTRLIDRGYDIDWVTVETPSGNKNSEIVFKVNYIGADNVRNVELEINTIEGIYSVMVIQNK